ncbi:MAG: hypothetical protein WC441_02055 [Patescibacteria group bacterium]
MKARAKQPSNHWPKILTTIFLIFVSSLFLTALVVNFSLDPGNGDKVVLSPVTPETATDSDQILAEEISLNISTTSSSTEAEVTPEAKEDKEEILKPDSVLPADLKGIKQYSAVISVVDEQGLKVINQEVFKRDGAQVLSANKEWVLISLDQTDKIFRVFCQNGFGITDCSGGQVSRLKSGDFCAKSVEKDTKNTISLACDRVNK